MSELYAIKNTYNNRYSQYIGNGCYRWVDSIYAADGYELHNASIRIDELKYEGIRAIEQRIEVDESEGQG